MYNDFVILDWNGKNEPSDELNFARIKLGASIVYGELKTLQVLIINRKDLLSVHFYVVIKLKNEKLHFKRIR